VNKGSPGLRWIGTGTQQMLGLLSPRLQTAPAWRSPTLGLRCASAAAVRPMSSRSAARKPDTAGGEPGGRSGHLS